jgi:O-antigen ligase
MIAEHPLGIGFGQFKQQITKYANTHEYALDAHNYYLLAWSEFGFLGLVVLLCLLYRMLGDSWALAKHAPDHFIRHLGLGLWACLIATLFVNCFGSRFMDIQVCTYLWVLSAVAASARDAVYEEEDEPLVTVTPLPENPWGLRSYLQT